MKKVRFNNDFTNLDVSLISPFREYIDRFSTVYISFGQIHVYFSHVECLSISIGQKYFSHVGVCLYTTNPNLRLNVVQISCYYR